MHNRAVALALIPAFLVALFIVVALSGAAAVVKVVVGIVFLGASLVLLYKAGTLTRG